MITFSLNPIVDGRCGCSKPDCVNIGKCPPKGWNKAQLLDPAPVPTTDRGVGVLAGEPSGIFVVDLDIKKGVDGIANFAALGEVPPTYAVRTPSGGYHLYFKHPGFRVKTSASQIAPGVDVRGDGGYVVAPGSPHANGGRYSVAADLPIAEAPAWLLARPELRKSSKASSTAPAERTEAPATSQAAVTEERVGPHVPKAWRIAMAKDALSKRDPAVQGQGGDGQTFWTLNSVSHDWCLTDQDMIDEAFVEWNARCIPPWTGSQWAHKVEGALHKSALHWNDAVIQKYALATHVPETEPPVKSDAWGVIDWNKQDPPVNWLVDGIIQESTVSLAYGLPNSLKTWACYQFAAAVAAGAPWLGRQTRKGLVVILDYESSERQARRRMRLLRASPEHIRYVNPTELLRDVKLWERLGELRPSLVLVDSLARGALTEDENATAMQVPLDLAKRLSRDCDAATIFVHHKNKSGKEGQASVRGNSSIYAAAEGALEFLDFERVTADVQRARLHCDRLKEWTAFDDIQLELSNAKGLIEVPAADAPRVASSELNVDGIKPALLLQAASGGAQGVGEYILLRKAGLRGPEAGRVGKQALIELAEAKQLDRKKSGPGYIYRPSLSPEQQKAAVLAAIDAGLTAQTEIVKETGADVARLLDLSHEGVIYKSGGMWLRTGRSLVTTGGTI